MPRFDVHRLFGGRSYWQADALDCPTLEAAKRKVHGPARAYVTDRETGRIVAFAHERDGRRRTWHSCNRAMTNRSLRDLFCGKEKG